MKNLFLIALLSLVSCESVLNEVDDYKDEGKISFAYVRISEKFGVEGNPYYHYAGIYSDKDATLDFYHYQSEIQSSEGTGVFLENCFREYIRDTAKVVIIESYQFARSGEIKPNDLDWPDSVEMNITLVVDLLTNEVTTGEIEFPGFKESIDLTEYQDAIINDNSMFRISYYNIDVVTRKKFPITINLNWTEVLQ